jgi:hypothetical protein
VKFLSLILSVAAILFFLNEASAATSVSFQALSQQYSQAHSPSADELLNHEWDFAAVVGNPSLVLNQGSSDRVNLDHGLKNPDGSQMYLWFRSDVPQNLYPFLSVDRRNNFSANESVLFYRVDQDLENKDVAYAFDAGANDGTYYLNQCRLNANGDLLLCQVIYNITAQATNPIYQQPKYQQANGKVVVIQAFKRDL